MGTAQATARDVVRAAQAFVGVPYVQRGRSLDGVDCAGLVRMVADHLGVPFPSDPVDYTRANRLEYVRDQVGRKLDPIPVNRSQPGVVLVIRPRSALVHLSIMDTRSTMITATNEPGIMRVVRRDVDWAMVMGAYKYRGVVYK